MGERAKSFFLSDDEKTVWGLFGVCLGRKRLGQVLKLECLATFGTHHANVSFFLSTVLIRSDSITSWIA